MRKLQALHRHHLATGDYFEDENGHIIPRGYAKTEDESGSRPDSEPDPRPRGVPEPESGEDWTESEPPSDACGAEDGAPKAPFPEERPFSGPRIRPLGDW